MPVTGNNILLTTPIKSVSIRLRSGGLSFFYTDANGHAEQTVFFQENNFTSNSVEAGLKTLPPLRPEQVAIYVDTSHVLFVPNQILATVSPAELLPQAGIKIPVHHNVIVTESVNGICGLYTLPAKIQQVVESHWQGSTTKWYSPIHELLSCCLQSSKMHNINSGTPIPEPAENHTQMPPNSYAVYITLDNMYVLGFGCKSEVILCESYPCGTEAEAIYILTNLTSTRNRRDIKMYIYGDRPVRYTKVLKKYYPKTKQI